MGYGLTVIQQAMAISTTNTHRTKGHSHGLCGCNIWGVPFLGGSEGNHSTWLPGGVVWPWSWLPGGFWVVPWVPQVVRATSLGGEGIGIMADELHYSLRLVITRQDGRRCPEEHITTALEEALDSLDRLYVDQEDTDEQTEYGLTYHTLELGDG